MIRVLILLFFLPLFCIGQLPDPLPGTYVNDLTQSLSIRETLQLNERLSALEKQTSVQLAVLLIKELPSDISIEEYAKSIGNKWKAGTQDHGIVYVCVLNGLHQRLEIATDLEGNITDITALSILNDIAPLLKQKEYFPALSLLILEIGSHLGAKEAIVDAAGEWQQQALDAYLADQAEFKKQKAKFDGYMVYAGLLLILGAAAFSVWAYRYGKRYRTRNTINGIYMGADTVYYATQIGDGSEDSDSFDHESWSKGNEGDAPGGGASVNW
jgi:uncharacterized protein